MLGNRYLGSLLFFSSTGEMSGQHYRSGFTLLRSVTPSRIFTAIRWLSSFHCFMSWKLTTAHFLRCSFQSIYHSFFIPLTRLRGTEGDRLFQASSRGSCKAFFTPILPIGNHLESWLFKTHLTPSYRLFSAQDATLVRCFEAPSLAADQTANSSNRN